MVPRLRDASPPKTPIWFFSYFFSLHFFYLKFIMKWLLFINPYTPWGPVRGPTGRLCKAPIASNFPGKTQTDVCFWGAYLRTQRTLPLADRQRNEYHKSSVLLMEKFERTYIKGKGTSDTIKIRWRSQKRNTEDYKNIGTYCRHNYNLCSTIHPFTRPPWRKWSLYRKC